MHLISYILGFLTPFALFAALCGYWFISDVWGEVMVTYRSRCQKFPDESRLTLLWHSIKYAWRQEMRCW